MATKKKTTSTKKVSKKKTAVKKTKKKTAAATGKKASKKKAAAKTTTRKKQSGKGTPTGAKRDAAAKRKALNAKLKQDLAASRAALRSAKTEARNEIALVKETAAAEIGVLKAQLNAALKREKELLKVVQQKTQKMWQATERWEREQLARIKRIIGKRKG